LICACAAYGGYKQSNTNVANRRNRKDQQQKLHLYDSQLSKKKNLYDSFVSHFPSPPTAAAEGDLEV
jgi:hypothetical protein